MKYRVTDKGGKEILPGDEVTYFRGNKGTFQGVSRGPVPGKTAKVLVDGFEYYANVFDLIVEAISDTDAS
jgi:hypothetical protein